MAARPEDAEHNPAAQEFLRQAYSHADAIYAVPQPEAWDINLGDHGALRRFMKYQYRPLAHENEVRLIKLYHASTSTVKFNGNALPQCEIFHADLRTGPKYDTISYAWGALHETETIFINNDSCLEITRNIWSALDVFRHKNIPMVLWADQLCIDQHNLEERRRQVALMQKIYSQARNTVIWLGQSDPTADAAFSFIEKVSKLNINQRTVWQVGVDIVRFSEEIVLAQHHELREFINRERQGLRALSRLLRKPWFARMWCFQEVVVSKNLLYFCGMAGCTWKDLYKAVGLCYEEPLPPIGWSSTSEALKSRERHLLGQSDELLELLRRTSYCLCTDPRDKIYAVLNVQSRRNPIEISADYTRTIRDVYIDTTKQIITRTRSLAIFILRRENVKSDIPGLPTWVPDFAAVGAPFPVEHHSRSSFCASAHRPYISHGPDIIGQLYVRGNVVDRVLGLVFESLSTSLSDDAFAVDKLYPTMLEILRGRMTAGKKHSTDIDPVAEKLIRTLTADLGGHWDRKQQAVVDNVEIGSIIDALRTQRTTPGVLNPWLQRFRSETRRCTSRAWIALEKKTIGLGPKSARPGDLVAVFNGSTIPLIIRPKGYYFELVGQCFVDGMMYGEICTWPDEQSDTFFLI
jgi:Heterokaryon incompatibility protein (HET)